MDDEFATFNFDVGGTGIYPQNERMTEGYDYDGPKSVQKLPRFGGLDFEPDLDGFVLEHRAKLTDLVSSALGICGFLVSDRLFELLVSHNVAPGMTSFPAPVYQKNQTIVGYRLLYAPHLGLVGEEDFPPREVSELLLREAPDLDFFVLRRPSRLRGAYVSPRLAAALRAGNYSGIRLGRGKLRKLAQ